MNGFTLAFCPCLYRNRLFNTVIWAMITDVIDDAEVKNKVREDGTVYSLYSFAKVRAGLYRRSLVGDDFSSGWISGTAYA